MIVNAYLTIDPNGDRPYLSTREPRTLDKKPGIQVFHYALVVPDKTPADNPFTLVLPEKS